MFVTLWTFDDLFVKLWTLDSKTQLETKNKFYTNIMLMLKLVCNTVYNIICKHDGNGKTKYDTFYTNVMQMATFKDVQTTSWSCLPTK